MSSSRENLIHRKGEAWMPPACTNITPLRRFFDMQAKTMWNDLSEVLPNVRGTLIDAGCGAQPYRGFIPSSVKYIGIDQKNAEEHFGYKTPDTIYYEGMKWPLESGVADTVLTTETLEHVPNPDQYLAEAYRCLKRGGKLILTVPFSVRWHYVPYDYFRYTPSGLNKLFSDAGFKDVEVYARGNSMTVFCYKGMLVCMPFLSPQKMGFVKTNLLRLIGVAMLPFFVLFAVLANISLCFGGGDDCLGYTAFAKKL